MWVVGRRHHLLARRRGMLARQRRIKPEMVS
jgi:hypothetical protein